MSCKQESYKRLGDYIQEVDVRNSAMEVNLSQGICNMKYFQNPRQVSSTPHLDKIVRKGQFAYNRATTRNGNKISIAYREGPDCTVSSAYCVFYITDEEVLNPYYLWLWFKRPDFDKYAIFKSHGSAHEFFEFETLCNTYIPMPPIEEQRKIVNNYLAIQYRIENNKKTIAKLEETAQAIYRKMFVDDIDPENLPDGWRMGSLSDIVSFKVGGDKPFIFSEIKTNICNTPIYSNGVENEGLYGYTDKPAVSEESVTVSARGNVGSCFVRRFPYFGIVRLISLIPNKKNILYYLFYNLSRRRLQGDGSAQSQITVPQLKDEEIIIPEDNVLNSFYEMCTSLRNHIDSNKRENLLLNNMLSIISF